MHPLQSHMLLHGLSYIDVWWLLCHGTPNDMQGEYLMVSRPSHFEWEWLGNNE